MKYLLSLKALSPILAMVGLYNFITAFFSAKQGIQLTSSCTDHDASNLLEDALGLTKDETQVLFHHGLLSTPISPSSLSFTSFSENKSHDVNHYRNGCWMNRRVESIAIIVVDALRFDFALAHLPLSIGSRLHSLPDFKKKNDNKNGISNNNNNNENRKNLNSQLFKFVADPPTVTMQRLKGLTTGGLPTFADIIGSFGGAHVDEDSWVDQLKYSPFSERLYQYPNGHMEKNHERKIAFVGDDTWVDLFPTQFDDSHPYPSFNTRDLDTVDDGCLSHLPRLLKSFGSLFEVLVVHFLGVDHVGHTYGPHNEHMTNKLNQIDSALSQILNKIDDAKTTCQTAFIFGDHGMTEDGNHGGGTSDETNAALFAHFSPGCGDMTGIMTGAMINGTETGSLAEEAFLSVNQIDLVPTISLLLGLPIPFANLGGLVPTLLPPSHFQNSPTSLMEEAPVTATALALNAAQVWNYFQTYSKNSNSLPKKDMKELEMQLKIARDVYKSAILSLSSKITTDEISSEFYDACGLFKLFLSEATAIGKRIWTRFDTIGMNIGIAIIIISLLLGCPESFLHVGDAQKLIQIRAFVNSTTFIGFALYGVTSFFAIFHCVLITFSNSFIEAEQGIIMKMLATICILASLRYFLISLAIQLRKIREIREVSKFLQKTITNMEKSPYLLLILPFCSRINENFMGHGKDPKLREYISHSPIFFIISILLLGILRYQVFQWILISNASNKNGKADTTLPHQKYTTVFHSMCDYLSLILLCYSWNEKYSQDINRNGYMSTLFAMILPLISLCSMLGLLNFWSFRKMVFTSEYSMQIKHRNFSAKLSLLGRDKLLQQTIRIYFKFLILLMAVTGPSSSITALLFTIQCLAIYQIIKIKDQQQIQGPTIAFIWRLVIRHTFFCTGHACSFNRLQFSAAFVATSIFHFIPAGLSLFHNTFGWYLLGSVVIIICSIIAEKKDIWEWYFFYQLLEILFSCISVSLLKRHLMVWAIFAPRFAFGSIFFWITCFCYLIITCALSFSGKNYERSGVHNYKK